MIHVVVLHGAGLAPRPSCWAFLLGVHDHVMLVGTLADTVKKTFEESVDELLGDSIGNAIQSVFVWMERDMDGVMTYGVFISIRITSKVMKALNDLVVTEWRLEKFAWLMCEKVAVTDCSEEPSPTNCELFGMMIRLRPVTTISTLEFAAFRHALERDNALMRSKALQLEKLFIGVQLQVVQCRSASDARSIEYLQEEVALLSAQVGKLASPPMHWVRNCDSGVVHRPIIWSLNVLTHTHLCRRAQDRALRIPSLPIHNLASGC